MYHTSEVQRLCFLLDNIFSDTPITMVKRGILNQYKICKILQ